MKKLLLVFAFTIVSLQFFAQVSWTESLTLPQDSVYGTHAVGVVDINGDGLDDIASLYDGNGLFVWLQDENGNLNMIDFGNIGEDNGGWDSDNAWGICWADIDNNGFCDLVAGGSYDGLKICLMNDTGDGFDIVDAGNTDIFLQGVNFFDANYDGFCDIFACHDDGVSHLLLNDGNGSFEYDAAAVESWWDLAAVAGEGEMGSGNYGSVFSDVTGDGYADLYIAKCRQGVTNDTDIRRINQLWVYDANTGVWTEEAEARGLADGAQSWSADFADMDNDGDMDCFIGNHDQPSRLMINDGTGMFTDIADDAGLGQGSFPFAVIQSVWRDFDNDGWIDLLVSGGGSYVIAYNNGDNTFDIDDESIPYELNSFGLGDLNNDGFVDVFATAGGYGGGWGDTDPDTAFLNDGNDNYWVKVDLEGTVSNVDGIGAIIIIEGPFGQMRREVRSGESYGIMNSMIAHFGIGAEDSIENIWVYWPSGIVDLITDVDADQTLDIIEGSAVFIGEHSAPLELEVYPNPTVDVLNLAVEAQLVGAALVVFDEQGRRVLEKRISNAGTLALNVSDLSTGNYVVRIMKYGQPISQQSFVKR